MTDYLLSEVHTVGKWKAKFFRAAGFNKTNMDLLLEEIIEIAHSRDVKEVISSPHGTKYVLEGSILTPEENYVSLRTVWVIDKEQNRPRFVTAYPLERAYEEGA